MEKVHGPLNAQVGGLLWAGVPTVIMGSLSSAVSCYVRVRGQLRDSQAVLFSSLGVCAK